MPTYTQSKSANRTVNRQTTNKPIRSIEHYKKVFGTIDSPTCKSKPPARSQVVPPCPGTAQNRVRAVAWGLCSPGRWPILPLLPQPHRALTHPTWFPVTVLSHILRAPMVTHISPLSGQWTKT